MNAALTERERAGNRQHLLLTAGQLIAEIAAAFLQAGKQRVDPPDRCPPDIIQKIGFVLPIADR